MGGCALTPALSDGNWETVWEVTLGWAVCSSHCISNARILLSAHITILHDGCLGNARWTNVRSLMCVIIPCAERLIQQAGAYALSDSAFPVLCA
jgi:hypothetical protein